MCKVSVVIPVYKKEKYLPECISSILNQTFEEFELICVNDCSPDRCSDILRKFEKEDARISVLDNKQNLGAAYSRNRGLGFAKGEYILFLDSDDMFDLQLISETYRRCKKNDLDVLIFDYTRLDNKIGAEVRHGMPLPIYMKLDNESFSNNEIKGFSFQICLAAPWIKMCRREFLLDNGIYFQDLSSSNDVFFGKTILVCASRIGYLDKNLVNYRDNTEYQISKNRREGSLDFCKAMIKIKENLNQRGMFPENARSFHTYALETMLSHFYRTKNNYRDEVYEGLREMIKIIFEDALTSDAFLNKYDLYWLKDFIGTPVGKHMEIGIDNKYKYIFRFESEKIKGLDSFIKKKNCKAAVWGYGKNGRHFIKECKETQFHIDDIVDINYKAYCDGEDKVFAPDMIGTEPYIVLVPSATLVKNILENVREMGQDSLVVDLQSYLSYGFKLDECVFR